MRANVGAQQIERLRDTDDGKVREVRLRIPVDEGDKYRIGKVEIAGNKAIKTEFLRSVFDVKEGDYYNKKKFVKGYEKAKGGYGAFGYMEFTMQPEMSFPGRDPETDKPIGPGPVPPVVDVTLRMNEGKQYFVNQITFVGNTTTHDIVVRRDMRLYEGGVFNTEALKESIRRINQLGYFKPIEQDKPETVQVDKTAGADNKVNITLKVEEQNRNQLAFGAGVSQFEGFFGQLSFQTANFLGRGETVGLSAQKGVQASNYQASFSEPYVFDRPISAGVDIHKRTYIFPLAYTQESVGSNVTLGVPVAQLHAGIFQLQLRAGERQGHQPLAHRHAGAGHEPVSRRRVALEPERAPQGQPDHAEHRLQYRQPADLPDRRTAVQPRLFRRGIRSRRQHGLLVHVARGHLVLPVSPPGRRSACTRRGSTSGPTAGQRRCRSSRNTSWAASTACGATTSAASARATSTPAS